MKRAEVREYNRMNWNLLPNDVSTNHPWIVVAEDSQYTEYRELRFQNQVWKESPWYSDRYHTW
jgi:hypothetical protein